MLRLQLLATGGSSWLRRDAVFTTQPFVGVTHRLDPDGAKAPFLDGFAQRAPMRVMSETLHDVENRVLTRCLIS